MSDQIVDLITECGDTAQSKGFWDSHVESAKRLLHQEFDKDSHELLDNACDTLGHHLLLGDPTVYIMLMISELGEAMEAYRKDNYCGKDGVAEELADTMIRIFDFVARFSTALGFTPEDFSHILRDKMNFNKQRPPLHGKKF